MAWEKFENIRGPKGDKGDAGSVSTVSVATLPPEAAATAVITGGSEAHLALGIPRGARGERGPAGSVASASAKSVPAGEQAAVRLTGTDEVKHMEIDVPRGLPGAEAMPTAEAVGAYLGASDSPSQDGFDAGAARLISAQGTATWAALTGRLQGTSFSVKDFGATGDGLTDDTAAIQLAMDAAGIKQGTLHFPPGEYNMDGYVTLRSNVDITGTGATLRKRHGSTSYACFAALSNGAVGYGSSVENVTVSGLRFRGTFEPGSARSLCGFALHHARNMLFHDLDFTEAQGGGHCFDLGGCDGVTIRDCTFRGFMTDGASLHSECIQVDVSSASGVSVVDNPASYDALPSINISVDSCIFAPLTIGAVTYPAPVPMGSHSASAGQPHRNIQFTRNRVLAQVENTTSGHAGAVHFIAVDGLLVADNVFDNPDGVLAIGVGVRAAVTAVTAATAATGGETLAAPMMSKNVQVIGNQFVGYSQSSISYPVIYLQDAGVGNSHRDCVISGNTAVAGVLDGTGQGFCRVRYSQGVIITGNRIAGSVRAINTDFCDSVTIQGNSIDGSGGGTVLARGCTALSVSGNSFSGFTGPCVQASTSSGVSVLGNTGKGHHAGDNATRFEDCDGLAVSGNTFSGTATRVAGVSVSGTSRGVAVGNICVGYGSAVVAGPSAAVEQSANVTLL